MLLLSLSLPVEEEGEETEIRLPFLMIYAMIKLEMHFLGSKNEAGRKNQHLSDTGDQNGKYHCEEKMEK